MARVRRSAYGRMTTHMLASMQLNHMRVILTVEEAGASPNQVVGIMTNAFLRNMRHITMLMVYAARSLAPTSHGDGEYYVNSLADSIVYIPTTDRSGRLAYTIGVDADRWKSTYDERYAAAYGGKNGNKPPWGSLENNKNFILYMLHEYWSLFANRIEQHHQYRDEHMSRNKMGELSPKQRAEAKRKNIPYPIVEPYISGLNVGEKFIFNGVNSVWKKASRNQGLTRMRYSSLFPEVYSGGRPRAGVLNQTRLDKFGVDDKWLPPSFDVNPLRNVYGSKIPWYWVAKNKKTALDRLNYITKYGEDKYPYNKRYFLGTDVYNLSRSQRTSYIEEGRGNKDD